MDCVLLLHEKSGWNEKTKDYLELGGYEILEGDIANLEQSQFSFQIASVVLIEGEEILFYSQMCKKIRAITDKPIMVLSKNGEEWGKIKIFQSGADDYLVSPYVQSELMARVRAHIERYNQLKKCQKLVKVKDMVINVFTRQVYVKEELVPLRLKEFEILLFLVQNSNRVVTKEEIYHVIWNTDEYIEACSNTVAVHIKRIREKIEDDVESPKYVETVWGVGYRFHNPDVED